jgi:hypothetical protein
MGATNKTEVVFDADSSGLDEAMRKQIQNNRDLENAIKSAAKAAADGHKAVIEYMAKESVSTKQLIDKNEELKNKIKELKDKQDSYYESANKGLETISAIGKTMVGGEIIGAVKDWIMYQEELNRKIAQTQIEYDKTAIKARAAMMMSQKEFAKVREEQIFPLTQQYKISEETATQAYTVASALPEKDRAEVVKRAIEGARAAGIEEGGIVDYQKSLFARLSQEGKQITGENVHAAALPTANIFGTLLKMTGEETLSTQQTIGKVEGINQDQMAAEFATLVKKGGMLGDKGKAAQQLSLVATGLHALPKEAQEGMGEELTGAVQGRMEKGDIMGALSQIKSSMDQQKLSPQARSAFLNKIVGRRSLASMERLIAHQDFAKQTLEGGFNEETFGKRLGYMTEGDAGADVAVEAAHKEEELKQKDLIKKNQLIMKIAGKIAEEKRISTGNLPLIGGAGLWGQSAMRGRMYQEDYMGHDVLSEMQKDKEQNRYSQILPGSVSVDEIRERYERATKGATAERGATPKIGLPGETSYIAKAFQPDELKEKLRVAEEKHSTLKLQHDSKEIELLNAHKIGHEGQAGFVPKLNHRDERILKGLEQNTKAQEALVEQLKIQNKKRTEQKGRNAQL